MNRKQFLKNCACAVCSCAVAGAVAPLAAAADEKPNAADWRLAFAKDRYARLMGILARELDEKTLGGILRQVGAHCARQYPLIQQHKGDLDGFMREFKARNNEDISFDRATGVIMVAGPERGDCYCPLIDRHAVPQAVCNCSLGWQQHAYETLLGKKVEVELKESVVHGGRRCVFQIHVLESTV
jgi:hypothetical protein